MIDEKRLAELTEECRNVPFGNSQFQIEAFIASEHSQERRYRTCLLQFDQKMQALQSSKYGRDRTAIKISQIERKMIHEVDDLERELLKIDLDEKKWELRQQDKLIEDCMIEVATYVRLLDDTPRFTREQFERSENSYWSNRLLHEAQVQMITSGSVDSNVAKELAKIGISFERTTEGRVVLSIPKLKEVNNA